MRKGRAATSAGQGERTSSSSSIRPHPKPSSAGRNTDVDRRAQEPRTPDMQSKWRRRLGHGWALLRSSGQRLDEATLAHRPGKVVSRRKRSARRLSEARRHQNSWRSSCNGKAGAPGTIRTSDPQIRSLIFGIENAVGNWKYPYKSMVLITRDHLLSFQSAYYLLTGNCHLRWAGACEAHAKANQNPR